MSNVVRLPSASESYITIRKSKTIWCIDLVTPAGPKSFKTTLERHASMPTALARAEAIGQQMRRPVKLPMKGGAHRGGEA